MHFVFRENANNLNYWLKIKVSAVFFSYSKHIIKLETFYLWVTIKNIDICDISDTSEFFKLLLLEYEHFAKIMMHIESFSRYLRKEKF